MTHDPLCPRQPYEHVIERVVYVRGTEPDLTKIGTTVTMWTADEDACVCDLIAKVREDTLAAAVQRIEALRPSITILGSKTLNWPLLESMDRNAATDAIKGE